MFPGGVEEEEEKVSRYKVDVSILMLGALMSPDTAALYDDSITQVGKKSRSSSDPLRSLSPPSSSDVTIQKHQMKKR